MGKLYKFFIALLVFNTAFFTFLFIKIKDNSKKDLQSSFVQSLPDLPNGSSIKNGPIYKLVTGSELTQTYTQGRVVAVERTNNLFTLEGEGTEIVIHVDRDTIYAFINKNNAQLESKEEFNRIAPLPETGKFDQIGIGDFVGINELTQLKDGGYYAKSVTKISGM